MQNLSLTKVRKENFNLKDKMKNKITQDFLKSAHDVLSGNAKPFHQQAQEEYIEMWLNDDIHLEDIDEQKLVDLYAQFENNEISEQQFDELIGGLIKKGIKKVGSAVASGAKKVAKRLSTQGRTDAAKKKIKKLKTKHDAKKKKVAQKSALKRTKSALAQAKKKYK